MRTPHVPMDRVLVRRALHGLDIQFGDLLLSLDSQEHWYDIAERVNQEIERLTDPRLVPLPRTDNVKPTTDYSSVNCSGACYSGEDE